MRRTTWKMKLPTTPLGIGPVRVVAKATYKDGGTAVSAPLELDVAPPGKPGSTKKKRRPSRRDKKGDFRIIDEGTTQALGR